MPFYRTRPSFSPLADATTTTTSSSCFAARLASCSGPRRSPSTPPRPLTDVEHSTVPHRHAPQRMPLGGELGDVTNKMNALNVADGADASKVQACAPSCAPDGWD